MKRKWTFVTILREAMKKSQTWRITNDGLVRCERGLCPLGILFTPRCKISPDPTHVPVPRLVALRIAYAADSDSSPDRDALLKALRIG